MDEKNDDAIARELQLRQVRRQGREFLKGRERDDFIGIGEKFENRRATTEQLYRAEYKTRVQISYRELLHKAGQKRQDFKPSFFGIDRFNRDDLMRQAQMNVRHDHLQTMARLDKMELKESKNLIEKSSQRKTYLEDFKQATERRGSEDRRQTHDRRRGPTMSD